MRKEAVYTLLLNATLFHGMRCTLAQDPRYIRFSVFEASATTHYNLRVRVVYCPLDVTRSDPSRRCRTQRSRRSSSRRSTRTSPPTRLSRCEPMTRRYRRGTHCHRPPCLPARHKERSNKGDLEATTRRNARTSARTRTKKRKQEARCPLEEGGGKVEGCTYTADPDS